MAKKQPKSERKLTFTEALILLIVVIAVIFLNAMKFKIGTGLSVLSVAMILAAYGMLVLHISWDSIMEEMLKVFQNGMGAVMILLMVGFIGGSWTASGTTPMLIYYGLDLISPSVYLIVAFLLCAVLGMATGSAWAIISSVGLALMGVAQGLGVPVAPAAAAIAGGAYVGDMWSPFSDVPNLASACTRGTSFDVFKAMIPTQVPALVLSIALYGILGFKYAGGAFDNSAVVEIQTALSQVYHWNILLLLPLVVVIGGVALKFPIIPTLVVSSLTAVVEGVAFQGMAAPAAFNVLYNGVVAETGNEAIDKLLSGGGLTSMMSLILIIFCAFAFAGVIERIGLLKILLGGLASKSKSRGVTILLSMISGIASVYLTASVYVAEILNCRIWNDVYKKQGMSTLMNARVQNGGMSNWGMIVPWSGGVALVSSCFGLTWSQYAPYLFMTWGSMLFILLWGFLGKFTIPLEEDEMVIEETVAE